MLDLRGVDDVLSVVGELDVGRGSGPLAVAAGVASVLGDGCQGSSVVGQRSDGAVGVGAVSGVGVSGGVRGLQVCYLGGVDHATVMREGSGAVLQKTWRK